jgi:lipopolysaccharide/colanic/teichoic acid biosynthesis glycosyltransferase
MYIAGRAKYAFDLAIAVFTLALVSPLLLIAAVGIKLTSPGPVLYLAKRIGRDRRRTHRNEPYRGREFTMYKFRTMSVAGIAGAPITAANDRRVFPWGRILRATKLDELPQLFNVIKGDMSLVGPRPEAPEIVRNHYGLEDIETLRALPGVTSPGTLYYYTHGEHMLTNDDGVLDTYIHRLLPLKLAIDRVYLARATFLYDVQVILRTIRIVVARSLGNRRFPDPPELSQPNAI